MDPDRTKPLGFHIVLLLSLCGVVFLMGLGLRDLWRPDEPRIAQVAREMFESGDWVVLRRNGELYAHKPPLTYWLVAAAYHVAGEPRVWIARLPSALAATGCVLLTYFLACATFGRTAGLVSGMVLATSQATFTLGGSASIDTILSFWMLAGFCAFWRFQRTDGTQNRWIYLAFFFAGLAVLTKGLVGIVLPVGVTGAYFLWDRSTHRPKWIHLFGGMILAAVVVLPWGVAADRQAGGEYIHELVVQHHFQRATVGTDHRHPWPDYYFYAFPWIAFPWVLFLPGAILWLFRKGRDFVGSSAFRFLMSWFVVFFVFFTISQAKRETYLVPALPATSILIGVFLVASLRRSTPGVYRNWFFAPLLFFGAAMAITGVGSVLGAYWQMKALVPVVWIGGPLLLLCGVAIVRYVCRGQVGKAFGAMTGCVIVLYAVTGFGVFPIIDRGKSLKPFSDNILALQPEGSCVFFWTLEDSLLFHIGRSVPELETFESFAETVRSGEPKYVITKRKYLVPLESVKDGWIVRDQKNSPALRIVVEDYSRAGLVVVTGAL